MREIPREPAFDSTLALKAQGYTFISDRCNRHGTDIFQTRLLLRPTVCLRGEHAARLFYDAELFARHGVIPPPVKHTLLGEGAVMQLDGEAHRWRKQMFMSLMGPQQVARLVDISARYWRAYSVKWEMQDRVVLMDEAQEVLCRAVCEWTGVPLAPQDAPRRARQFAALVDAPASVGARHWRGRRARRDLEAWIMRVVRDVREGHLNAPEGSALHAMAWHRDLQGEFLSEHVAAVELINVLRPTVAVSWFVAFAALALHQHPQSRERLRAGGDQDVEYFVHEVRRYYSFFPLIMARAKRDIEWDGYRIRKGTQAALDFYGTNRDARLWQDPDEFRPERFATWDGGAFNFIPQGGGDHLHNHRCAGEWITIALLKEAVRFLTRDVTCSVPPQDLRVPWSRLPTLPRSRFVMSDVRRTLELDG